MAAGHWCAYLAGDASGWDRTILGVAFYTGEGDLAGSRFVGIEKAIRRGDWRENWPEPSFDAPPTWEEMQRRLDSLANAMSSIRWEKGGATIVWSNDKIDSFFRRIVKGEKNEDEDDL